MTGSSCVVRNRPPGLPWNQSQCWQFPVPFIKISNVPSGHQIHYPCADPPEHHTHSGLGILMRTSILIFFFSLVWVRCHCQKCTWLFFFPPESWIIFFFFFLEHVENNSPCSSPQNTPSTYAKCYYCSSFRNDLKREIVCSKELQAVRCRLFIVTNLKYTSDGEIHPGWVLCRRTHGFPSPAKYSFCYSRTLTHSACKSDFAVILDWMACDGGGFLPCVTVPCHYFRCCPDSSCSM